MENIEQYANFKIESNLLYNFICMTINNNNTPSPMSWMLFKQELNNNIDSISNKDKKFGFIFDLKKLKMLSIEKIKEIVEILEKKGDILEEKLIASSIIVDNKSLMNAIFSIIEQFYKTKKPLKFLKNIDESHRFLMSNI